MYIEIVLFLKRIMCMFVCIFAKRVHRMKKKRNENMLILFHKNDFNIID